MASALDPNRLAVLKLRLERRLAARRAERADHAKAAEKGWATRRRRHSNDPLINERVAF